MNKVKTKDKILLTIISIFLFLSIVVIFIPLIFQYKNERYFKISSNDKVVNNVISINDLNLQPGSSKSSIIELECINTNSYKITLIFQETEAGSLKNYLDVEIFYNNKLIYKDKLSKLLSCDDVFINDEFSKNDVDEVTIIYMLPQEIGNEAQGTITKFDIKILIEQE